MTTTLTFDNKTVSIGQTVTVTFWSNTMHYCHDEVYQRKRCKHHWPSMPWTCSSRDSPSRPSITYCRRCIWSESSSSYDKHISTL